MQFVWVCLFTFLTFYTAFPFSWDKDVVAYPSGGALYVTPVSQDYGKTLDLNLTGFSTETSMYSVELIPFNIPLPPTHQPLGLTYSTKPVVLRLIVERLADGTEVVHYKYLTILVEDEK